MPVHPSHVTVFSMYSTEYDNICVNCGATDLTTGESGELERPCPAAQQKPPVLNESHPIWELVIEDMQVRDHVGRERYGTPLQAHNGRDALVDAYEEALDLCVYLRQAIQERGAPSERS